MSSSVFVTGAERNMVTQHYPLLAYRQPLIGICQLYGQEQDNEA